VSERNLAHRGGGLAFFEFEHTGTELELAPPERDGTGGDQHHFLVARTQPQQVVHECLEPRPVDLAARRIDEQRRADLDDHAACTS
jgi:hypothetical protein